MGGWEFVGSVSTQEHTNVSVSLTSVLPVRQAVTRIGYLGVYEGKEAAALPTMRSRSGTPTAGREAKR